MHKKDHFLVLLGYEPRLRTHVKLHQQSGCVYMWAQRVLRPAVCSVQCSQCSM